MVLSPQDQDQALSTHAPGTALMAPVLSKCAHLRQTLHLGLEGGSPAIRSMRARAPTALTPQ